MSEQIDGILVGKLTLDVGELNKKVDEANEILAKIGKDAKANLDALSSV